MLPSFLNESLEMGLHMLKKVGQYIVNILYSIDQFGNAVAGGCPDETISSRLGKIKVNNGGKIPWRRPLAKIIDFGLDKIDPGHSVKAIEPDEGYMAVVDTEYGLKRKK